MNNYFNKGMSKSSTQRSVYYAAYGSGRVTDVDDSQTKAYTSFGPAVLIRLTHLEGFPKAVFLMRYMAPDVKNKGPEGNI